MAETGFKVDLVSVMGGEVLGVRVVELPPVGTLVHVKSEAAAEVRIWRVESIRLEVGESGFGEYVVMVREMRESVGPTKLVDLYGGSQ